MFLLLAKTVLVCFKFTTFKKKNSKKGAAAYEQLAQSPALMLAASSESTLAGRMSWGVAASDKECT